jgi:hypothetical protein
VWSLSAVAEKSAAAALPPSTDHVPLTWSPLAMANLSIVAVWSLSAVAEKSAAVPPSTDHVPLTWSPLAMANLSFGVGKQRQLVADGKVAEASRGVLRQAADEGVAIFHRGDGEIAGMGCGAAEQGGEGGCGDQGLLHVIPCCADIVCVGFQFIVGRRPLSAGGRFPVAAVPGAACRAVVGDGQAFDLSRRR